MGHLAPATGAGDDLRIVIDWGGDSGPYAFERSKTRWILIEEGDDDFAVGHCEE